MELVSVLSTSGTGTVTNADGYYEIEVTEKDSIWFSYLNKPTVKFPVMRIGNPMQFDISLQVNVPVMKEVKKLLILKNGIINIFEWEHFFFLLNDESDPKLKSEIIQLKYNR